MLDLASARVPSLVGRDRELRRIREYIEAPQVHRVLVLTGPVGSGRTSLIRTVLASESGWRRYYLDVSPAAKPLGLEGVRELLNCFGREPECADEVVRESIGMLEDGTRFKLIVAVDGLQCVYREGVCITPQIVRGFARLVEAYSDRVRVIVSIDDQEAALGLGSVAEYTDMLLVEGLPKDAARLLAARAAQEADTSIDESRVDEIIAATGGLPYHILVVIHEYKGDIAAWLQDVAEKLRWKLALIAAELGISVRDAAKAILDMVDKPLSAIPRHSFIIARYALRNNIVYLAPGAVIRLQLPAYAGMLRAIAYGG